jgi:hypothetical protein
MSHLYFSIFLFYLAFGEPFGGIEPLSREEDQLLERRWGEGEGCEGWCELSNSGIIRNLRLCSGLYAAS